MRSAEGKSTGQYAFQSFPPPRGNPVGLPRFQECALPRRRASTVLLIPCRPPQTKRLRKGCNRHRCAFLRRSLRWMGPSWLVVPWRCAATVNADDTVKLWMPDSVCKVSPPRSLWTLCPHHVRGPHWARAGLSPVCQAFHPHPPTPSLPPLRSRVLPSLLRARRGREAVWAQRQRSRLRLVLRFAPSASATRGLPPSAAHAHTSAEVAVAPRLAAQEGPAVRRCACRRRLSRCHPAGRKRDSHTSQPQSPPDSERLVRTAGSLPCRGGGGGSGRRRAHGRAWW